MDVNVVRIAEIRLAARKIVMKTEFDYYEQYCELKREIAIEKADALDEYKAERQCNMGVGCGITGVCFAEANGHPEMCGRVTEKQDKLDY